LKKLLLAVLLCLAAAARAQAPADPAAPLFAASLHTLEDKPFAFDSLRGRPLMVNFWARTCVPCRDEIPELLSAHDKYGKRGLVVVGIALDDNVDNTRDFIKAYDMRYANLLAKAKGTDLMRSIGNPLAVVPFTLVINRKGEVIGSKLGPLKKAEIEAYAKQLLATH
jgi:thiol-disulfide isomerase/thioredoxin